MALPGPPTSQSGVSKTKQQETKREAGGEGGKDAQANREDWGDGRGRGRIPLPQLLVSYCVLRAATEPSLGKGRGERERRERGRKGGGGCETGLEK